MFLIVAYPLYFIIIASISDSQLVSTGKVFLIPKGISLFGYKEIFQDPRIWTGYSNTMLYTTLGTFVNLLFTLPAAYVLSRKGISGKTVYYVLLRRDLVFQRGIDSDLLIDKGAAFDKHDGGFYISILCECVLSDYRDGRFSRILCPPNCMRRQQ